MADDDDKPSRPRVSARASRAARPKARAGGSATTKPGTRKAAPSARAKREPQATREPLVGPSREPQAKRQRQAEAERRAKPEPSAERSSEPLPPASSALAPRSEPAEPHSQPPEPSAPGTVLITGICGRMGRLLARKLHRERPVSGIDRREFTGKPVDIVHHQLDLRRRKTRDIFRSGGIDAVVHLGVMHNLRESDRAHHEWNVVGFQKLLEYVSDYHVRKLIVLSSATLYGPSPDNPQFLSEEAPLLGAQEFFQIRDLVEVDMLAQSFFWKNPNLETVILRPCHILGRVRNAPSNYCRMERPITVMGFDPMMQVIHERDVVEAIALALRPGVRGIFNLRGPGELPLSRMLRILGKQGRAVPGPLIRGVMSRMWSYRASDFPTPELDHLRYICMVDDARARRELGFSPRYDMEQTLRAVYSER